VFKYLWNKKTDSALEDGALYAFDKKTAYFFVALALPLLFIPKINLISFTGRETAGIRWDDIFLLFFALFLFWGHIATQKKLTNIEKTLFSVTVFSGFSFLINRFLVHIGHLHVDANILYAGRIFEYFLFFYIGYYARRFFDVDRIIVAMFSLNFFLMIFQRWGYIGYWSQFGYEPLCTYRCGGIASFPSEMGMLLNFFFCYLLYIPEKIIPISLKKYFNESLSEMIGSFILFVVFAYLLMINGSRIAFGAHLVLYFIYTFEMIRKKFTRRSSLLFFGAFVLFLPLQSLVMQESTLFKRSLNLFSEKNFLLIQKVWDIIDVRYVPIGKEAVKHDANNEDTSWWMRVHKWVYAVKIYVTHPESYLQGIGPGFAMAGLDGGIIRIFVEYGLIGFCLYLLLFYYIAVSSPVLNKCILAFFINMCFFDVYLAYKPMALLFFLTGYVYVKNISLRKKRENPAGEIDFDKKVLSH